METGLRKSARCQFGDVTVDFAANLLLVAGEPRELEPKSFRLLTYLIAHRDRTLTKDEILHSVWEGAAVSDNALTRSIALIRKAIGDNSREPRFIATVPTVGYRFIAAVEPIDPGPSEAPPENPPAAAPARLARPFPGRKTLLALAVGLAAVAALAWGIREQLNRRWVERAAAQVEQYASQARYEEAHLLATQVLARDPGNAKVLPLVSEISDVLTVRSEPPGAAIYLRRFPDGAEEFLGTTPLENKSVPRREHILQVRQPGYREWERTASSRLPRNSPLNRKPWDLSFDVPLSPTARPPAGMVRIDAKLHKLAAHSRPVDATVPLVPFLIDKHEVTHRQFKEFIDAGGYSQAHLWKDPSVRGSLKDKTGVPAPRDWVGGGIPDGKSDHPVANVTWHEAYAYCRFRGGTLPTLFEWEEAARGAMESPFGVVFPWGLADGGEVPRRANLEGSGVEAVGRRPFGMSPYGVHDMAGNLSEWLLNPFDGGYATAGGSWNDPVYAFGLIQSRPAQYNDAALGFRCAATDPGIPQTEQARMAFTTADRPLRYPASTRLQFETAKERYRPAAAPLNARLLQVVERESWRREEIAFDGFGGKRAKAYLYLPRNAAPPYQTIHYLGGTGSWLGVPVTSIVESGSARMAPFLRTGRAVFLMVLQSFEGREPVGAYGSLEFGSAQHLAILREWAVDMQRGMDYLLSRSDIDGRKIAFWNTSTVESGLVFAALDGRYAATIWNGVGVRDWLLRVPPEANALFYAPHVPGPKLILTGRYDEQTASRVAHVDPLYQLLSHPKRHHLYVGGHVPAVEVVVPVVNAFLDQSLGALPRR